MKVSELIARLQECDQDAEVHFSYNYGDHARATVAPSVRKVRYESVAYVEYYRMPVVLDDEDDARLENATEVVVLS